MEIPIYSFEGTMELNEWFQWLEEYFDYANIQNERNKTLTAALHLTRQAYACVRRNYEYWTPSFPWDTFENFREELEFEEKWNYKERKALELEYKEEASGVEDDNSKFETVNVEFKLRNIQNVIIGYKETSIQPDEEIKIPKELKELYKEKELEYEETQEKNAQEKITEDQTHKPMVDEQEAGTLDKALAVQEKRYEEEAIVEESLHQEIMDEIEGRSMASPTISAFKVKGKEAQYLVKIDKKLGQSTEQHNSSFVPPIECTRRNPFKTKQKHDYGGMRWAIVLPSENTLAGWIFIKSTEKKAYFRHSQEHSISIGLWHHYKKMQQGDKLELYILSIILTYYLQSTYSVVFPLSRSYTSKLLVLIAQVKVNAMGIVHMPSPNSASNPKNLSAKSCSFRCPNNEGPCVRLAMRVKERGNCCIIPIVFVSAHHPPKTPFSNRQSQRFTKTVQPQQALVRTQKYRMTSKWATTKRRELKDTMITGFASPQQMVS
eukprot:Gb_33020 [translate_table: standard]